MPVPGLVIDPAAGHAQADDGGLREIRAISRRIEETFEKIAMQPSKIFWRTGRAPSLAMRGQQDTEIVIPHIGREIISRETRYLLVPPAVYDGRLQDFDHRKSVCVIADTDFRRNDVKLDRISIIGRIVPMRPRVETVVDHPQGTEQVVPPPVASGEIGKIGRRARAVRGAVVLVKAVGSDRIYNVVFHPDMPSEQPELTGRGFQMPL